jgi:hypothetical protein
VNFPRPFTLLPYEDRAYRPPTPSDVRAVIDTLGLTADRVAALVGMKDGRAVRRWLAPEGSKTHAQIDYAAWRLLLIEAGLIDFRRSSS